MVEKSNLDLLNELGVEAKVKPKAAYTAREERIIAGFKEVQRFVEENERVPLHGENRDIFERLYATRLDQIRKQADCIELLKDLDHQGLLAASNDSQIAETPAEYGSDSELLAELGLSPSDDTHITKLQHVKPRAEIRAAEEVAQRMPCSDFDTFKPVFESVQKELSTGLSCLLYTSPSPRDQRGSRMPSSA